MAMRYIEVNKKTRTQRGFTLLYAVLISSILLAIGIAIFEITVRELRLSSVVRESQYAFYAADSGIECVLYWDMQASSSRVFYPGASQTITCDSQSIPNVGGSAFGTPNTFSAGIPGPNRCVSVTVTKSKVDPVDISPNPAVRTVIDSRGYNVACSELGTNASAVERTLRVTY